MTKYYYYHHHHHHHHHNLYITVVETEVQGMLDFSQII